MSQVSSIDTFDNNAVRKFLTIKSVENIFTIDY